MMGRRPPRKSARTTGNGRHGPGGAQRKNPLAISWEEAAYLVSMHPRTLKLHLKRTDAACLVRIGKRYRLDRKGFYRWCRLQGFEGASSL